MKEIVYSDKTFLLTNKEFKEAMLCWNQKSNYWCQRIEQALTPMFLHAGTPDIEMGREIYLFPLMSNGKTIKLRVAFKDENGNYYEILDKEGSLMPIPDVEIKGKELILQEDYYNRPKLLNKKQFKQLS